MTIEQDILALVQPSLDALSTRISALENASKPAPVKGVQIGTVLYPSFAAAAAAAKIGDTLQVFGQLVNDSAVINVDCTIVGMTPDAGFNSIAGYSFIWGQGYIVANTKNLTVKNLEFQNMRGSETNTCGIRGSTLLQYLAVDNCNFHDGYEGMLVSSSATANTMITNSRFSKLGYGDAQTHSVYITGNSLTVDKCVFQAQYYGSMVKSRCLNTTVKNSILAEYYQLAANLSEKTYNIDICNGGVTVISNNIIQQGIYPDNHSMFSFGSEGLSNPNSVYHFYKNIVINDYDLVNKWVVDSTGKVTAAMCDIHDNVFAGPGFDLTFGPVTGLGAINNNKVFATRALAGYPEAPRLPIALV